MDRIPSGAKARVLRSLNGTAEAVPYLKPIAAEVVLCPKSIAVEAVFFPKPKKSIYEMASRYLAVV